jgi:hypothetical protein
MDHADEMKAYERLTRELRTMHHSERDKLDAMPNLAEILRAVHEGREHDAIAMTHTCITAYGNAWREKNEDLFPAGRGFYNNHVAKG